MDNQTIKEGKTLAWVSYLPIFGIVIAFFLNNDRKNPFTSFHIRQSIGIWLFYFICGVSVSTYDSDMLRLCLWVCFGSLLLYGFINAFIGKTQTVPLIGDFFQKWFSKIGQ
ncbi:hypothetical protein [uncultured Winogradskyella sp.]|uniref:hypothetical protein n=1 Tax=uncultured Winogradskyella sp. TaxID=395353 RepID=UPI0030DB1618|tara:strand:+ start:231336 stop:231668 length:333 start_codon:yes stop_codon:yes gene_type:complete